MCEEVFVEFRVGKRIKDIYREGEMAALLPMRATRATFCLVIVIVFGSMFVSHADAQSSDDCVNWLDVCESHPLPCMIVLFADLWMICITNLISNQMWICVY